MLLNVNKTSVAKGEKKLWEKKVSFLSWLGHSPLAANELQQATRDRETKEFPNQKNGILFYFSFD